jgi:hypothetical protein
MKAEWICFKPNCDNMSHSMGAGMVVCVWGGGVMVTDLSPADEKFPPTSP